MTDGEAIEALARIGLKATKTRPQRGEPWVWEIRCMYTGVILGSLPVHRTGLDRIAYAIPILYDAGET